MTSKSELSSQKCSRSNDYWRGADQRVACAIYMQVFFFLSAVTTSAMSLLIMRSVHNMDCPRTRWP